MFIRLLACAVVCLSGVALGDDAGQDVSDAIAKLSDAGNYSWRAVTTDAANPDSTMTQDGKTDMSGYTFLNLSAGGQSVKLLLKGRTGVMNAGDGWKSSDDLAGQRRAARVMSGLIRDFKSPLVLVRQLTSKLKDLKPDEDAIVAEVSGKEASDLLGSLSNMRGNMEMFNARATVKFWIQDGNLTKYEVRATGTISRNGNDSTFNRTFTVEFSDVGNTTVDVPDDAKQKLDEPSQE